MMKLTGIKTKTYKYNDEYYVDIVDDGKYYNAWIYKEDYGKKSFIVGGLKEFETEDEFVSSIENYIEINGIIELYEYEMEINEEAFMREVQRDAADSHQCECNHKHDDKESTDAPKHVILRQFAHCEECGTSHFIRAKYKGIQESRLYTLDSEVDLCTDDKHNPIISLKDFTLEVVETEEFYNMYIHYKDVYPTQYVFGIRKHPNITCHDDAVDKMLVYLPDFIAKYASIYIVGKKYSIGSKDVAGSMDNLEEVEDNLEDDLDDFTEDDFLDDDDLY